MKKFTLMLAGLAMAASAYAQDQDPNRLILTNTIGNAQGYVIDRVQDITFARVDGEVKAEIDVLDVQLEEMTVAVTKTEDCMAYKLDVVPVTVSNACDDVAIISYINRNNPQVFTENFTHATLTGISLMPATEYDIVTVGIDRYGVEDGVCRVRIKTPRQPLIGNPEITAEVVDRQLKEFSVKFIPNDDVSLYFCVAGEKGTMQSQYEMFGPMMGFLSFTDMIMSWGHALQGEQVITWRDMAPNQEYEVFYVATDEAGTPCDYQVLETSTLSLGGEGVASVEITLGDYTYTDWDGELLPSQYITYTPNDQASCYRFGVYKAEVYDENPDSYKAELCSDPWMPTAYWFFYETFSTDYQIDPDKEVVAIAAAKNSLGEWGPVNELRFVTPSEATGSNGTFKAPAQKHNTIKARKLQTKRMQQAPGKAPIMPQPTKIQLR